MRVTCPTFHNAPVLPDGPVDAHLLIVGLAPGRLGANRTGVPFSGDPSGTLLRSVLEEVGGRYAITNVVRCLPPGNTPTRVEIATCRDWLREDLARFEASVILALGRVAFDAVLAALETPRANFGHGVEVVVGRRVVVGSYHPSPLVTRTGRMSREGLVEVVRRAAELAVQNPGATSVRSV